MRMASFGYAAARQTRRNFALTARTAGMCRLRACPAGMCGDLRDSSLPRKEISQSAKGWSARRNTRTHPHIPAREGLRRDHLPAPLLGMAVILCRNEL